MNIFRLAGDMTHLISVLVLLLKIYATKSCSGISLKTQELYAIVFVTRYLDLFTDFISLYNTVMKLVFIGSSLAIVWCMRYHRVVRRSYDRELDTFRYWILLGASFILALVLHEKFTLQEMVAYVKLILASTTSLLVLATTIFSDYCEIVNFILQMLCCFESIYSELEYNNYFLSKVFWAFSIYLEAVAILPQLVLLQRSGNVDNLAGQYVFFLGAYRAFYILNWIYRYLTEQRFTRWISCVSGLVQTALYADFFYYYFISWKNNAKLQLPA